MALRPWLAPTILHGADGTLYGVAALGGCLAIFGEFLRGSARSIDRFDLHNWYGFAQSAGLLLALGGALLVGSGGLEAALFATVGVQACLCVVFLAIMARASGVEPVIDTAEARAHLRYGVAIYPQGLVNQLHERLDMFVLAALGVGPGEIAFYAVAVSVIGPLRFPRRDLDGVCRTRGETTSARRRSRPRWRARPLCRGSGSRWRWSPRDRCSAGPVRRELRSVDRAVPLLLPDHRAVVSRALARYFATVARQGVPRRAVALALNVSLLRADPEPRHSRRRAREPGHLRGRDGARDLGVPRRHATLGARCVCAATNRLRAVPGAPAPRVLAAGEQLEQIGARLERAVERALQSVELEAEAAQ
jgi:hypothetical protein